MTNKFKTALLCAALSAGCLAAPQAGAQSFAVQVNGVTCVDNAACDVDPTVGQITYLASVAGFSLSLNSSLTNTPGAAPFSFIDMGWIISAGAAGGGGAITFLASATGFTYPSAGSAAVLTNQFNGNFIGTGTASGQSWMNTSNALFGMTGLTAGAMALNSTNTLAFTSATPYSLTQAISFNVGAGSVTSGDFATHVVPEPAPLALIAIALGGLALARRRKQA